MSRLTPKRRAKTRILVACRSARSSRRTLRPAASSAPSTSLSSSTRSSNGSKASVDQRDRGKAARRDKEHHAITPLVLGSLALSIPLIAVAGAQAGPFGVAMVCIAIVLVNLFVARR